MPLWKALTAVDKFMVISTKSNSIPPTCLSICIATYNRVFLVTRLVEYLVSLTGDFEICVHVDGSSDGSFEQLCQISDPRLRLSYSENMGFGPARANAFALASGRFTMWLDDDDTLLPEGLEVIMRFCSMELPAKIAGYVFHVCDPQGNLIGNEFDCDLANLFNLRFDSVSSPI